MSLPSIFVKHHGVLSSLSHSRLLRCSSIFLSRFSFASHATCWGVKMSIARLLDTLKALFVDIVFLIPFWSIVNVLLCTVVTQKPSGVG